MAEPTKDIVLPLTLTDLAKTIRELFQLLDDVTGRVKTVSEAYGRSKGRKAARSLDILTFQGDGSRQHLERIIAGEAQKEDFEAIASRMDETGAEVEAAINRLRKYRSFIAENIGLTFANRLNDLIYAKGGKASIRLDLEMLAKMEHSFYSDTDIVEEAKTILANIDILNKNIESFHDDLMKFLKNKATTKPYSPKKED